MLAGYAIIRCPPDRIVAGWSQGANNPVRCPGLAWTTRSAPEVHGPIRTTPDASTGSYGSEGADRATYVPHVMGPGINHGPSQAGRLGTAGRLRERGAGRLENP